MSRKKNQKATPLSIKEDDFLVLDKLLGEKNRILLKFVESFCYFRMSNLGFIKDMAYEEKLVRIIDEIKVGSFEDESGRIIIIIPPSFEAIKKILLKIKDKENFEMVIQEVQVAKK